MQQDTIKPKRIAMYCRSATGDAESIEEQIHLCRQWCQEHFGDEPYEEEVFIDERGSGTAGWREGEDDQQRREALARLIAAIDDDRVDVLVVSRLDRLFRSVTLWVEFAELCLSGDRLRLASLGENVVLSRSEYRLMAGVLATAASVLLELEASPPGGERQ